MNESVLGVFDHARHKPTVQLQRLARMLKFCAYSKFINYTFLRLNNKVADQTAQAGLHLCC